MMDYKEFKEYINNHIRAFLPESFVNAEISITDVIKNNSMHLDGLIIRQEGCNICPTIYLNRYYEQFNDGRTLDDILTEIAGVRITNSANPFPAVSELQDFSKIKDRITAKLINLEKNAEYLADKPYTTVADLAVIYFVDLSTADCKSGYASVVITKSMLSVLGISLEELHATAMHNMSETNARFVTMAEMLEDLLPAADPMGDVTAGFPMYILTNTRKMNGAAMLLNPDTMDMIAETIGSDYIILPSSIHESIIVPDSALAENHDISAMVEMVKEVNSTQVSPDEILSDHVYRYNYISHSIEIAA